MPNRPVWTDEAELHRYLDDAKRTTDLGHSPAPTGLEIADRDGVLAVTVTPVTGLILHARQVTINNPSDDILKKIVNARGVEWVATDLTATAETLVVRGHRLESAFCLRLAERVVDAEAGRPLFPERTPDESLAQRYLSARYRIRNMEQSETLLQLIRLDSVNALLAAELNAHGVPWDSVTYEALMASMLSNPRTDDPYPRLAKLSSEISKDLHGARFDWRTELPDAFDGEGIVLTSSRLEELVGIDHPAVPKILRWRELDTLAADFGYDWAEKWVRDGRWWPRFRPAGTVSGRWSGQGGALQLPRSLRACVSVEPGRMLVVADLAQLEPRMLAHLSGDPELISATARTDLYAEAGIRLGMDRDGAKQAILSAIYDNQSELARRTRKHLVNWFPMAMECLDRATARGRRGGRLRTGLGRISAPPDEEFQAAVRTATAMRSPAQRQVINRRGRKIRNFLLQANGAELANTIAAELRSTLHGYGARIILFAHDEYVIDAPLEEVDHVQQMLPDVVRTAARQVLGSSEVSWPLTIGRGRTWAEAAKK